MSLNKKTKQNKAKQIRNSRYGLLQDHVSPRKVKELPITQKANYDNKSN